jgi:hypothetical protein
MKSARFVRKGEKPAAARNRKAGTPDGGARQDRWDKAAGRSIGSRQGCLFLSAAVASATVSPVEILYGTVEKR